MTALGIVVDGVLLGSVYALVALGFSLVWGVLNVLNLAHGAFIMLGAYATLWLWRMGLDPFMSIPLVMLLLFAFGWLVQRTILNRLLNAPLSLTVSVTFGLDTLLVGLAIMLFTADNRSIDVPGYLSGKLDLMQGLAVPHVRLAVLGVSALLAVLLWAFMVGTRTGQAIRATRLDRQAARLMGVKVERVYALAMGISGAVAGAAGALIGITFYLSPTVGQLYLVKTLVATTMGGLGSVASAMAGGIFLGLLESAGSTLVGATYTDLIGFALVLLMLLVRPSGLFGKEFYEV